jgi:cell division protein FtsQ
LKLDDGMVIELGRQQAKVPIRMRLQRFVDYYPSVLSVAKSRPTVVDMRYPNGFALRLAAVSGAVTGTESKGKQ